MADQVNESGYSRRDAMENGIANMTETVFTEKAMTPNDAADQFESFVMDGLQSSGYSDLLTDDERVEFKRYAKSLLSRHDEWIDDTDTALTK